MFAVYYASRLLRDERMARYIKIVEKEFEKEINDRSLTDSAGLAHSGCFCPAGYGKAGAVWHGADFWNSNGRKTGIG